MSSVRFARYRLPMSIRDRWCQLSSSIIVLREDSACVQLTRRHGDRWQCFRSLRYRGISLCYLLTNGYPAERAEASLSLSLSLSLAGKTRIICVGTCGFPRRNALAKEKGLLWRVGNYIGKWGRETEIRPQNFYFCIISIFNLYWEKIQFFSMNSNVEII